jgi:nitrite reductase (NADH) small subunit
VSTGVRTSREYRVGPVADVPEGGGILLEAGGVELGLFKVGGRLHAYENRCRHQGGPVCTGEVIGRFEAVVSPDGTIAGERFADDEVRIACPWHGWEYDLATGECTADRRYRLRSFPVSVRDGDVFVRV